MATVEAFLSKRGEDFLGLQEWIAMLGDETKVALALSIAFRETELVLPLYWRASMVKQIDPELLPGPYAVHVWAALLQELGDEAGWPDLLPEVEGTPERFYIDLLVKRTDCESFCKAAGLDNPLKSKVVKRHFPRPANWDFWKKCGRFQAGELVWLSLGYEPYGGPVKGSIREEWEQRFTLLSRNLVDNDNQSYSLATSHELKPYLFVEVAEFLEWSLPAEFYKIRMGNPKSGATGSSSQITPEPEVSERERNTYLNIVGGLLALMLSPGPTGRSRSGYDGQAAVIEALLAHFPDAKGLSKRNLEKYFAAAKRNLEAG